MEEKKSAFAIPNPIGDPFPVKGTDKQVIRWLVDSVLVSASATSIFARVTVPIEMKDAIIGRAEPLIGGKVNVQKIPKSRVKISLVIGLDSLGTIEGLSDSFGIELSGTRFWLSVCRARGKVNTSQESIKDEHQRLLQLSVKQPKCSMCGALDNLHFSRPEKSGYCVTTLLMTKKRWAEAEELAKSCTVLCWSCNGKATGNPKRPRNDDGKSLF